MRSDIEHGFIDPYLTTFGFYLIDFRVVDTESIMNRHITEMRIASKHERRRRVQPGKT